MQKGNRNSIFIFVNRRLIRDRLLLHAISSAYHNLMPPAAFPVRAAVSRMRLRRGGRERASVEDRGALPASDRSCTISCAIRIRERLIETRPAPAFSPAASAQPAAALPYSEFSQMLENEARTRRVRGCPQPDGANRSLPEFALRPAAGPEPRFDFGGAAIAIGRRAAPPAPRLRVPETHGAFPPDALPVSDASLGALSDLRPLGQIHDSFIIAAGRDGLWIIDQHVAHERILFEKRAEAARGRATWRRSVC